MNRSRSKHAAFQGPLPATSQAAHRRLDQPTQAGERADENRRSLLTKLMCIGVSKSLTRSAHPPASSLPLAAQRYREHEGPSEDGRVRRSGCDDHDGLGRCSGIAEDGYQGIRKQRIRRCVASIDADGASIARNGQCRVGSF